MLTHAEFGEVSVCIQFAVLPYTRVRLISYLAGINARCLTRITVLCVGSTLDTYQMITPVYPPKVVYELSLIHI